MSTLRQAVDTTCSKTSSFYQRKTLLLLIKVTGVKGALGLRLRLPDAVGAIKTPSFVHSRSNSIGSSNISVLKQIQSISLRRRYHPVVA
ncbi:hypothetical protein VTN77DRAFT_8750 [Rasamsonia byssochlamydoides]|uniref:uncharacterized protein n=1 Tax=Rasamsonia byssochlamydoides TaxID=89139 RepID=UPI00374461C6